MKNYGFIYLWYDKKHKRFYVGSHWGSNDDGYVCSSSWMKKSYKRRINDFKRRILSLIYTNRKDLLKEEHRWLSMIKNEELGKKYYNLCNHKFGHWSSDENLKMTVGEKISKTNKSNPNFGSWNIGRKKSKEEIEKISKSTSLAMIEHYKNNPRTEETRKKISDNNKRLQAEGKIGMKNKKHSNETKQLMSINNAMNKEENRKKISDAKKGIKWLKLNDTKKMAVPGTEKFNHLISLGFEVL